MSAASNMGLLQRYRAAVETRDVEAVLSFYRDDIAIHVPGSSPLNGEHVGKDAARRFLETSFTTIDNSDHKGVVTERFATDKRFGTMSNVSNADGSYDALWLFVYEVDGDGLITEIDVFLGRGSKPAPGKVHYWM